MKRKSYGNEAQVLHDAQSKDGEQKVKPDIKVLEAQWWEMMDKEPDHQSKTDKSVQFSAQLILNEDMLDQELLERIRHNNEYNDDRIFDQLSIFKEGQVFSVDDQVESKPQDE